MRERRKRDVLSLQLSYKHGKVILPLSSLPHFDILLFLHIIEISNNQY